MHKQMYIRTKGYNLGTFYHLDALFFINQLDKHHVYTLSYRSCLLGLIPHACVKSTITTIIPFVFVKTVWLHFFKFDYKMKSGTDTEVKGQNGLVKNTGNTFKIYYLSQD